LVPLRIWSVVSEKLMLRIIPPVRRHAGLGWLPGFFCCCRLLRLMSVAQYDFRSTGS
jgi:hypothetical protein